MLRTVLNLYVLFLAVLVVSCKGKQENTGSLPGLSYTQMQDTLKRANKALAHKESMLIDAYIERHQYKMIATGTGLRYMIYKKSDGEAAQAGKLAKVNFEISLLNGTHCYSSKEKGAEEFLIDQDAIESGLHEGIKFMKVGEKAVFILPAHRAHGLVGDQDKIPPLTPVVYDIELVGLRNP